MEIDKINKKFLDVLDEESLYEMSNVGPKVTGLKYIIWISVGHHLQHGPRIKITLDGKVPRKNNSISVSIENNPKIMAGDKSKIRQQDLAMIQKFIKKNKDVLLSHWNGESTSDELISQLKGV